MNSISFFKALLMKELNEKDLPGNQEKIAQAAPPKDKITGADFAALRAKKGMKKEDSQLEEKVDMAELESELNRLKKENPGKKVTYTFKKDSPKGYVFFIDNKLVKEGENQIRPDLKAAYDQGYKAGYAKCKYDMDGTFPDIFESEDHEVSMAHNSLESIIKSAMELKMKLGDDEKDIPAWIQDHITNAENYINQASKNYHEYSGGEHDVDELPVGNEEVPVDDKPEFISERREYDQEAMEKLGFNLYPGGRTEAWEFATEELGVSPAEILGKMSDDDVYNAISDSLEILGYYNDEDEDLSETSLQKIMEDLLEAKKKPSAGLTKKQKSAIVKKAKSGKDMGKKGKGFEKIVKAAKKSGAKDPEAVAGAAFWKGQAKKSK